jgi:LPXTG-site transpeptidase (sortase) family protein
MTLLEDAPPPAAGEPEVAPPAPAPAPEAAGPRARAGATSSGAEDLLRALTVLLVVAVVAVAGWKGFDQLVAPSMYRARQHHLAADFAVARSGLAEGQAAAVLQIPGIGANLVVVEGSGAANLRAGPGHRPGTPLPGQRGNSIIEGHRTRWGAPFGRLGDLVPRTRIIAIDRARIPVEYRVTTVRRVKRADLDRWLAPSRDHRLTLITHAGGAFSDDRLVVQAVAGSPAKRPPTDRLPDRDPPSDGLGLPLAAAVVAAVGAVVAWRRLRPEHPGRALLLVVVPLGALAVLALVLAVDTALSPLL